MLGATAGARSVLVVFAVLVFLAVGVGDTLAADYQDAKHNVCEGTFFLGSCAWGAHVTGERNIALGDGMMPALTTGSENIALDFGALLPNTTGFANVALGPFALNSNTTGYDNVASGARALASNSEGKENVASGVDALERNTTGSQNVASGIDALKLNTVGVGNVAIGSFTLTSNTEGHDNGAIGELALTANTTGVGNEANGSQALEQNTTGNNNTATGWQALTANTEGIGNIATGVEALDRNTTGSSNVADGGGALLSNTTGSSNVAVGPLAGESVTTGSNNVDVANHGAAADEGITRVGSEGTQTKAYVAGVYKKPVGSTACAVKANSEGQLGCNEEGSAVATFATRSKLLSGQCLAYTDIGPAGNGACPAKTTGFSTSTRLAPMPGNGGTVSDLYVDTNATLTGSDTAVVEVIDNTTGAKLVGCTVTSSSPHSCSNTSEPASAGPGENIELKITANGASGNEKAWRVTFRF